MNNLNEEITVFIVDDNEEVRDSLKMLIESVGLIAETYDSAQSYLDKFEASRAGCLILDVRMKGMSGLSLQEYLNKNESLVPPIIIITGSWGCANGCARGKGRRIGVLRKAI